MFHGKGCCAVQWLRHFSASTRGDFATTSLRKLDRLNPGRKKKAFREDCARIWGNLYDYSTTKYQDNHTPVLIGCPLHGIFRMRPRDHIQRRLGCPKCGASIPGSVHDTAAMLLRGRETPRLGQHVLQSYSVADEIAKAAVEGEKHEEKWIAEIGVGTGVLTSALLRRSGCLGVVGFELDEEILKQGLVPGGALHRHKARWQEVTLESQAWSRLEWTKALRDSSRCFVLKGNVLNCQIPGHCQTVVGNIPYRISSALISKLLRQEPPLQRIVLMVQMEFAKKLMAKPGTMKFGVVSAMCAALCASREVVIERLPPDMFDPPPRVDSQVLKLEPHQVPPASADRLEQLLRALLKGKGGSTGLAARDVALETALENLEMNKMDSALQLPPRWRLALGGAQLDPATPVAQLTVEDLVKLCNALGQLQPAGEKKGGRWFNTYNLEMAI
eukprot:symbB.v1.2.038863.t1/scaffold6213.1/size20058/1